MALKGKKLQARGLSPGGCACRCQRFCSCISVFPTTAERLGLLLFLQPPYSGDVQTDAGHAAHPPPAHWVLELLRRHLWSIPWTTLPSEAPAPADPPPGFLAEVSPRALGASMGTVQLRALLIDFGQVIVRSLSLCVQ